MALYDSKTKLGDSLKVSEAVIAVSEAITACELFAKLTCCEFGECTFPFGVRITDTSDDQALETRFSSSFL